MKVNFPKNIKEAIIMSLPNCTVMVLGMMTLNLWIYGALTWEHFFAALPRICTGFFHCWSISNAYCS